MEALAPEVVEGVTSAVGLDDLVDGSGDDPDSIIGVAVELGVLAPTVLYVEATVVLRRLQKDRK